MDNNDSKHAIFSTTQVAATLSTVLILVNMYMQYFGKGEIKVTPEQMMAVATIVTPIACNLWIQYRRFKPQKAIHIKKKG